MTFDKIKWDSYVADVVGNIAHRGVSLFGLTTDDLSVIALCYGTSMSASSVASLLQNLRT
jgi:hypothetical protein